jgi:hypothetical protein
MTLKVLRCKNGDMMELMREETAYDADAEGANIWATEDAK